jgi:hypothetical protein
MKFQFFLKTFLTVMLLGSGMNLSAQKLDSIQKFDSLKLRNHSDSSIAEKFPQIKALTDSFWYAIKTNDPNIILKQTPPYSAYKEYIDSTPAAKFSETTLFYKHKYFYVGLSKQYKRLRKSSKKLGVILNRAKVKHAFYEFGIDDLYQKEYCYINLELDRNKKSAYRIRILLLKMGEEWYYADELALLESKDNRVK